MQAVGAFALLLLTKLLQDESSTTATFNLKEQRPLLEPR